MPAPVQGSRDHSGNTRGGRLPVTALRLGSGASRDARRESGPEGRSGYFVIRREEGNRTVQSANPDLGGTGVEIESAFFVDL
jgi:hypothetical protein